MNFQNILDGIKGMFQPKLVSPMPASGNLNPAPDFDTQMQQKGWFRHPDGVYRENKPSSPTAIATPTVRPKAVLGASSNLPDVTEDQIRRGWAGYGDGNAPAATASATFAEVANQYPILKANPGLLPAMAMKETSGGKAGQNKNWFNWGIYQDDYQEGDPNQVIRDVARAIGSDDSNSSHYYKKFRETGNIRDMLDRYAPPTENDTNLYHRQLLDWIEQFK